MTIDLYINNANDYAHDIGAPVYHPHVSVIHYDEVGEIRHSLNIINCYGIFLHQIGGKQDDGTHRQYHGWVLIFDNEFIHGSVIDQKLDGYHFFNYHSNEALILTSEEKHILEQLMANLRSELETQAQSPGHDDIIRNYILLILDYCNRFYLRQFKETSTDGSDILSRFHDVLTNYYTQGIQKHAGLPSVKYCAAELCLSPSYFGEIMGYTPKQFFDNQRKK